MSEFYFYAYTIGSRWGNNGVQCKNLSEARRTAEMFAKGGDCIQARVSVSATIGKGAELKIETLFVERYTSSGFVAVLEAA